MRRQQDYSEGEIESDTESEGEYDDVEEESNSSSEEENASEEDQEDDEDGKTESKHTNKKQASKKGTRLPEINKKEMDKIKRQEYVDFEKLLPVREKTREDAKSIEFVASGKGYQMETKAKKRRIEKFNDWEEAWQIFRRTASFFKVYPMEQLVTYHDTIFRYQQRYTFEAVLRYDRAYRKTVVNLQDDFYMDGQEIFAENLEG